MSFTVRLETDHLTVDAGQNTPLTIEVANRGEATDQFELEIEGLDPEWTAVPVPTFSVPSGEVQRAKIFFKPERSSENVAGAFPFVVRVRSLESGEIRTAQGMVQIKPYFHLTMELDPRKGSFSPTSHQNVFTASIVNLGNCELTLQLFGSDPKTLWPTSSARTKSRWGPASSARCRSSPPPRKSERSRRRDCMATRSARGASTIPASWRRPKPNSSKNLCSVLVRSSRWCSFLCWLSGGISPCRSLR